MDFKYTVHAKADAFVLCVYFCKRMHMTIFSQSSIPGLMLIRQNLCGEARKRDSITWSIGSLDFIGFRLAACDVTFKFTMYLREKERNNPLE